MNTNEKKIAITGPFADVNFGDYAMLVNNIYDLDIKNLTLFSYDNEFLKIIKEDYLSDYNLDIIEIKLNDSIVGNDKYSSTITPIEILSMVDNYDEIYESLKDIDVLLVNGGGYFNGLWSMPHRINKLIKIIVPILIANRLNKEIRFSGNSYGPFGEDKDFFTTTLTSLRNTTFGCRDNLYSPVWAREIGIKETNIKNIPDDLFFINSDLLNKSLSYQVQSKKYIVMETYLSIDFLNENSTLFKSFSDEIKKRYDLDIVFMPLNIEHGGMQQAVFLNEILENYEYIDISRKGYLPIQDAVNIIRDAQLVVSSRYHSMVVALATGTPTISVLKNVLGDKQYYYNKNSGMLRLALKDTGFDERFYLKLDYLETLDFIIENFNEIIEVQGKNYNEQYLYNKECLKKYREEYLNEIKNLN